MFSDCQETQQGSPPEAASSVVIDEFITRAPTIAWRHRPYECLYVPFVRRHPSVYNSIRTLGTARKNHPTSRSSKSSHGLRPITVNNTTRGNVPHQSPLLNEAMHRRRPNEEGGATVPRNRATLRIHFPIPSKTWILYNNASPKGFPNPGQDDNTLATHSDLLRAQLTVMEYSDLRTSRCSRAGSGKLAGPYTKGT